MLFGKADPDTDNAAVGEILEPRYVCVTSSSAERVGRDLSVHDLNTTKERE